MSPFSYAGRLFLVVGIILIVVGVIFMVSDRFLPLGRLPGDIAWSRKGVSFFLPITTCILLSIILTIILNIIFRR